jgi:hypothetical protein
VVIKVVVVAVVVEVLQYIKIFQKLIK